MHPLATLIGPGARVRGDVHSDHPVEIRGAEERIAALMILGDDRMTESVFVAGAQVWSWGHV